MKKSLITTVILALLAGGVLAYFYVFERGPTEKKKEWEPEKIISKESRLEKITFKRPSGTIVFERRGNSWLITEPVKSPPDPILMNELVPRLTQLKKERIIHLHPENLKTYRLEDPQVEIMLDLAGQETDKRILVGKMNYTKDHLYAQLGSEPAVFLIKPDILPFLYHDLSVYRAKSLLLHSPSRVVSMEVKVLDPQLKEQFPRITEMKLIKQGQKGKPHKWIFVKPFQEASTSRSVELLLMRLHSNAGEKVIDIEENELAKYGLDDPRLKIIFSIADGTKEEVILGDINQEEKKAYLKNTARNEVIPAGMQTFSLITTFPFRKEYLLKGPEGRNITRIEINYPALPDKGFTLVHDSPRLFAFEDDPSKKSLTRLTQSLLRPFRSMPVKYVYNKPPYPREEYGLEKPRFTMKAYEDETLSLDVAVGDTATEGNATYTYIEDRKRNCLLTLPKDLYHHMPWKREYLEAAPEKIQRAKKLRRRHERERGSAGQKSSTE
ncbi:MAG: DUF4340 domain-containing protein [bacterium]